MGGNYSRVPQKYGFPPDYVVMGFRQPDCIQLLNMPERMVERLTDVLQKYWPSGIRSERRFLFGVELRLANDPFGNDSNNVERMVSCFQCCLHLLQKLLQHGYELVTNGHLIRGIERNLWIFRQVPQEEGDHQSGKKVNLCVMALEDWNKVIFVNCSEEEFALAKETVENVWRTGLMKTKYSADGGIGVIELTGQPWDSYKAESEKTPLLLLRLLEMKRHRKQRLVLSTHIHGVVDTLFFQKSCHVEDHLPLMLMSLNQQDQLRFYDAPSSVVNVVTKALQAKWEKGQLSDEMSGFVWTVRLKGSPWWIPEWDKDSNTSSRQLVTHLVHDLRGAGWNVLNTVNVYRGQYDKSLFIFTHNQDSSAKGNNAKFDDDFLILPPPHFFISSHDVDRLCVAGAPASIRTVLEDVFQSRWSGKVKVDNSSSSSDLMEVTLEGRPWSWTANDTNCGSSNVVGVALLCWVHTALAEEGCSLLACADIASCTKYSPQTFIFAMDKTLKDKNE